MSKQIGYIRVSTVDQNTARQLDGIPLDKTFTDRVSGKDTNRPALTDLIDYVREDDTVHVHSMDRLARSLTDLLGIVKNLTENGVTVHFHKEQLVFGQGNDSAMSTFMLQIMGAVAEFERALINERTREGVAQAKAANKYKGRKKALSPDQVQDLRQRVESGEKKTAIARAFGVSTRTVYNVIQDNSTAVQQEQ